jgi:adenylyl-sulfate kinase
MDKKIQFQNFSLKQNDRAKLKNQKPICLWMTGLSGSGKTTLANALEKALHKMKKHTYILDGDNIRHGLNSDLSFSKNDRNENVRRVAEIAKLMVDSGLIVIVGLISPFRSERDWVRSIFNLNEFIEIYISTSLYECENRDVKGLYQMAREGKVKEFTGINSPYEAPYNPEITIDTQNKTVDESVQIILKKFNFLD